MKKFFKILFCCALCVICFGLTACGDKKIDTPENNAVVVSNGGLAVQKGDHIYYVNGYVSVDDVTKSDLDKSYDIGGLYTSKTNSDKSLKYDEDNNVDNRARLSNKLSGFEATDIHIFGNYMYYTTINTEETKNGGLQTKHLEIYRVQLNGTNSKRVYRSGADFEDGEGKRVVDIKYYTVNNEVYILINEQGKLKRIKCTSSKIGSAETVASDVTAFISSDSETDVNNIVYAKMNDDIYELHRYNVYQDRDDNIISFDKNDKLDSLFAIKFGYLYYYATFSMNGQSYLYRMPMENFSEDYSIYTSSKKLTATSYTNVYLLDSLIDGILAVSSNRVEILRDNRNSNSLPAPEKMENLPYDANIMAIRGGYVYYYKDKVISRWNYTNDTAEKICEDSNTICNYSFDLDNNYLYYFATKNSNDYLFRVAIADRSPENTPKIVGRYAEADLDKKEEDAE